MKPSFFENNTEKSGERSDTLDILKFVEMVCRYRWQIVAFSVCVATIPVIYRAITYKPTYMSTVCVMTQEKPVDFVETTAPQKSGSPGDSVVEQSFEWLLASPAFLKKILAMEFEYRKNGQPIKSRLDHYYSDSGNLMVATLKLKKAIKTVRKKGMLLINVTTSDPKLSAAIVNALVGEMNNYYRERLNSNALANLRFVEQEVQQVNKELQQARQDLISFLKKNKQLTLFSGQVGQDKFPLLTAEKARLSQIIELKNTLYNNLCSKHELVKIEANKETPYMSVLEWAFPANTPMPRGLAKSGVTGFLVGFFLAVGAFFVVFVINEFVPKDSEISRAISHDLKLARRWLSFGRL